MAARVRPREKLLQLIRKYELTQYEVAELCQVSRSAIYCYTRPIGHKYYQTISVAALRLLRLELRDVRPRGRPVY